MKFKEQLDDRQTIANRMLEELDEKVKEFEEHRRQVESDRESNFLRIFISLKFFFPDNRSLMELKLSYEQRLNSSEELIHHWRLSGAVFKKKISNSTEKCKEYRKEIELKKLQFIHFKDVIQRNQKQIDEIKQERNQLDNVIKEKKKQLTVMAKLADELEKYKQAMSHEMYEM